MVLGILTAIAACPAIIGTTEAVRQGQSAQRREAHRGQRANLIVKLPKKNSYSARFDGSIIVLHNEKLYIQLSTSSFGAIPPHPFTGYYYPYPSQQSRWKSAGYIGEGLVSTISVEPPFLNWIYIDSQTHEVKYGVRAEAEPHHCGPWDCTKADRRVTFEGWEGFMAVQEDEENDLWGLYFDRDDDGLSGAGMVGDINIEAGRPRRRMLLVEISRREVAKTMEVAMEERVERLRSMARKEKVVMEARLVADAGSESGGSSRAETVVTIRTEDEDGDADDKTKNELASEEFREESGFPLREEDVASSGAPTENVEATEHVSQSGAVEGMAEDTIQSASTSSLQIPQDMPVNHNDRNITTPRPEANITTMDAMESGTTNYPDESVDLEIPSTTNSSTNKSHSSTSTSNFVTSPTLEVTVNAPDPFDSTPQEHTTISNTSQNLHHVYPFLNSFTTFTENALPTTSSKPTTSTNLLPTSPTAIGTASASTSMPHYSSFSTSHSSSGTKSTTSSTTTTTTTPTPTAPSLLTTLTQRVREATQSLTLGSDELNAMMQGQYKDINER